MKSPVIFFFAFLAAVPLHAQDARVSVTAKNVEVRDVRVSDAALLTIKSKTNVNDTNTLNTLEVTMTADPSEWQKLSLTFKAMEETEVTIQIGGARGNGDNEVFIDQVEVTSGTILNGDFEEANRRGPKNWVASNQANRNDISIDDAENAASGTHFVHLNKIGFLSQEILVPKDTEVTISAMIRSAVK